MKNLFVAICSGLILVTSSAFAKVPSYNCTINNPQWHEDEDDLKNNDAHVVVQVSELGKEINPESTAILPNGRLAQVTILNWKCPISCGDKYKPVLFQLQLFENGNSAPKNFVTYISTETDGFQKVVKASGQYFNKANNKLWDEYHLTCKLITQNKDSNK